MSERLQLDRFLLMRVLEDLHQQDSILLRMMIIVFPPAGDLVSKACIQLQCCHVACPHLQNDFERWIPRAATQVNCSRRAVLRDLHLRWHEPPCPTTQERKAAVSDCAGLILLRGSQNITCGLYAHPPPDHKPEGMRAIHPCQSDSVCSCICRS